jgi:hypothetical protein
LFFSEEIMETTTESRTQRPNFRALAQPAGAPAEMARSCLEAGFLPDPDTLVSFLVNALYLFGDQEIAAYGAPGEPGEPPEGVTAGLTRLGHPVATGRVQDGQRMRRMHGVHGMHGMQKDSRGIRAGIPVSGRPGGGALPRPVREGGSDRAVFLNGALGQGDDARILETLKAMRRTVRPGGLLCFHVFDRDRAWGLAGEREAGPARIRVGFAPETGRLSARVVGILGAPGGNPGTEAGGPGLGYASIKTWNLGEIAALLRAAGLILERAYGDWNGGSPGAGGAETGRLILVAARPRTVRPRAARKESEGRNSPGTGRKRGTQ